MSLRNGKNENKNLDRMESVTDAEVLYDKTSRLQKKNF